MQQYMNKIQNTVLFKGFQGSEVQQALGCLQGTIKDFGRRDFIFKQEEYLEAAGIILEGMSCSARRTALAHASSSQSLRMGRLLGRQRFVKSRSPAVMRR